MAALAFVELGLEPGFVILPPGAVLARCVQEEWGPDQGEVQIVILAIGSKALFQNEIHRVAGHHLFRPRFGEPCYKRL